MTYNASLELTKTRIVNIEIEVEKSSLKILTRIRYKPGEGSEHATDYYGYAQTELQPVMTLRNLSEEEIDQVKEFIQDTMAETIYATRKKSIGEKIEGRIKKEILG